MKKSSRSIQDGIYRCLYENYDEMSVFLRSELEGRERDIEEMRYLSDFIHYKNLDDEYYYFRKNAHEVLSEEYPFPTLVL